MVCGHGELGRRLVSAWVEQALGASCGFWMIARRKFCLISSLLLSFAGTSAFGNVIIFRKIAIIRYWKAVFGSLIWRIIYTISTDSNVLIQKKHPKSPAIKDQTTIKTFNMPSSPTNYPKVCTKISLQQLVGTTPAAAEKTHQHFSLTPAGGRCLESHFVRLTDVLAGGSLVVPCPCWWALYIRRKVRKINECTEIVGLDRKFSAQVRGKKNLDSPKNNIITLTMDFLQIKYFFGINMQYTDGELDFYKFRRYWNSKKKEIYFF